MIKGLYEAHLPVSNIKQSIDFYEKLGLQLAFEGERVTFLWIDKGKSWLGLWEYESVEIPYHPSIRHLAFHVELADIKKAKSWLQSKGIEVREAFGFSKDHQPLVLMNEPNAHAAIYFNDPDGNSIELITPLVYDMNEKKNMISLQQWEEEIGFV